MTLHPALFYELVQVFGVDEDFPSLTFAALAIMSKALFLAPLVDQGGRDARMLSRLFHCHHL